MADQPKQENENPTPENDNADGAENAFWEKFDARMNGLLDGFFDRKRDELRKNSSSRTGDGRMTIPGILANIMYGPAKKD